MRWQQKLTKTELKHVKETTQGRPTLYQVRANVEGNRDVRCPCWTCLTIGRKLGMLGK